MKSYSLRSLCIEPGEKKFLFCKMYNENELLKLLLPEYSMDQTQKLGTRQKVDEFELEK